MPSENPRLGERGLVLTDFVDRAADPVGIMAADGTFHRGEALIAAALRSLTYTATSGRAPIAPPGVTFPAHWRPAAVAALRRELARMPEWSRGSERMPLISDAAAALNSLHAEPGLPTTRRGRTLRFRRHRHQHHAGRRRRRLSADRPDPAPPRLLRRAHRPGTSGTRDRRSVRHRDGGRDGNVGDRSTAPASGRMPRREGTSVAGCGDIPVRRRARTSRRGTADPGGTRRRDPPTAGVVHRGTAGTPVPQPDSSHRPDCGRLRRWRRQHPCGDHRALRAAPGSGDNHRRARTDRSRRRRKAGGSTSGGRQPDRGSGTGAVDHDARARLVRDRRRPRNRLGHRLFRYACRGERSPPRCRLRTRGGLRPR